MQYNIPHTLLIPLGLLGWGLIVFVIRAPFFRGLRVQVGAGIAILAVIFSGWMANEGLFKCTRTYTNFMPQKGVKTASELYIIGQTQTTVHSSGYTTAHSIGYRTKMHQAIHDSYIILPLPLREGVNYSSPDIQFVHQKQPEILGSKEMVPTFDTHAFSRKAGELNYPARVKDHYHDSQSLYSNMAIYQIAGSLSNGIVYWKTPEGTILSCTYLVNESIWEPGEWISHYIPMFFIQLVEFPFTFPLTVVVRSFFALVEFP